MTTTDVVETAGVGRNTFYEHFENVESAISEGCADAVREMELGMSASVAEVRTPLERLRRLAAAWTEQARRHPDAARALFQGGADPIIAQGLKQKLADQLAGAVATARAAGAAGTGPDAVRIALVVGAFGASALHVAENPSDEQRAADALAELTIRAFR